eukprot:TRINITY_DN1873_c0_g2_i1.p1 TRINITY_DN1873_c0_g2~~TRINITY_DN1873_c0_g2_i1.p1  ORF type:complete len:194 (-),score=44.76 TRINITY_DN1873_c0_g2_i1:160-741(-)
MVRRASHGALLAVALAAAAGTWCLSAFVPPSQPEQGLSRRDAGVAAMLGALAAPSAAGAAGKDKPVEPPVFPNYIAQGGKLSVGSQFDIPNFWLGYYADPMHKGCRRIITFASTDGLVVSGTDGNPDCPGGKPVGSSWKVKAKFKPGSDSLTFDFSPKGGPSDVKGTWNGDGITFPDGNKWKRIIKTYTGGTP